MLLKGSPLSLDLPLISVIVPVYNAENFLPHCLDSIIGQSYENLEIIVVDDGSTDRSPSICDDYAHRDTRIRLVHQNNGGIAKAQNAGLALANGAFIAFVDNDDILDRRNIEILHRALVETGADMSKGRWRQFGISTIDAVASEAARGCLLDGTRTIVLDPLYAYQTVYCKSLRLIGEKLGRHTEARYFNEANWCRLYRADLWNGIRFPEGRYAQDVMVAGELYVRMRKVVDVDLVLYHWLQSPGSVTHNEHSFQFYQDNLAAGIENFRLCLRSGVTPSRSYYTIMGAVHEEATASDFGTGDTAEQHARDLRTVMGLLSKLSLPQRLVSSIKRRIRLFEKVVYDRKIKSIR